MIAPDTTALPEVSIIIPLHNKAAHILQTVDSVRGQTVSNWELVVVDNLSTDHGPSIVESLGHPQIRMISCDRKGVSAARNAGLGAARGTWLVFLDADDLLVPTYLEEQLKLATSSQADLVMCAYSEFLDGTDQTVEVRRPMSENISRQRLLCTGIVFCPGPQHIFMVRRKVVTPDLQWPEHLDKLLGEDATFWFRIINVASIAVNPAVLARYRIAISHSRYALFSDPGAMLTGLQRAIEENLHFLAHREQQPTTGQVETLMRFYANVYYQARLRRLKDVAAEALRSARKWQKRYFEAETSPSFPMKVRRWLGFPMFSTIFRHP